MVKFNTVIHVMDNYLCKCSNDYIRERLSKMTHEEKQEKLLDILSTEEYIMYTYWWNGVQWQKEYIESIKKLLAQDPDSDYLKKSLAEEKQRLIDRENEGFNYEKYIYRKHEPKTYSSKGYTEGLNSEIREIEAQKNVQYSNQEKDSLESYMVIGYKSINDSLWSDEKLDGDLKTFDENLSSAIGKHKLTKNTVVYNGGQHHDPNLKIGDSIEFKGYTSTSYDIDVARNFVGHDSWFRGCIYKFLAPKGTPCVNMNGLFSDTEFETEHECLLNKNIKGKIVGFDGFHDGVPIVVVQL